VGGPVVLGVQLVAARSAASLPAPARQPSPARARDSAAERCAKNEIVTLSSSPQALSMAATCRRQWIVSAEILIEFFYIKPVLMRPVLGALKRRGSAWINPPAPLPRPNVGGWAPR
jgi:hypothetical protein